MVARPGAGSARRAEPQESLSIGEVLAALKGEFPDVSISKIRFLEEQGLVEPSRTPSGYRRFAHHDVARLRFVLQAQRDHYLPLRVIREQLDALDRGLTPSWLSGGRPGAPRAVPTAPENGGAPGHSMEPLPGARRDLRLRREEVASSAGVGEEVLAACESFGLLGPGADGYYDADDLATASAIGELSAFGIEPRHLRGFRTAADRELGLVEQVVTPLRRQRGPEASARADHVAREISAACLRLHAALVRGGLDDAQR